MDRKPPDAFWSSKPKPWICCLPPDPSGIRPSAAALKVRESVRLAKRDLEAYLGGDD